MDAVGYICAIMFGMMLGIFACKLSDDDYDDNQFGY